MKSIEKPGNLSPTSLRARAAENLKNLEAELLESPTWQHRRQRLSPEPFLADE